MAKQKIMELLQPAVDEWLERPGFMSRWRGNREKVQEVINGCIRRYRYTGSFLKYLHRTLQYAARGLQPLYSFSLDEPVAIHADKRRIENVVKDPETGEIVLYGSSYLYNSTSRP